MTTSQDHRAPRLDVPTGAPDRTPVVPPPVQRGPVVAAAVVLLLWGGWLLVPEAARLDLLGGGPASTAPGAGGQAPVPAGPAGVADPAQAADPPPGAAAPGDDVAPVAPVPRADLVVPDAVVGPAPAPVVPGSVPDAVVPDPDGPVEVPRAGDGTFAVAPGSGAQVGDGRLVTYSVEVEGGVPLDAAEVAGVVESVLADPRSWTGQGEWALRRVDADPDARIVVTTPDTTDRMCAPLRTRGEVSCRNGDDVVLNAVRWTQGASTWGDDVVGYRQYLVNHELGHYLGGGHVRCPADGAPAPVMLQQTLGLQGCRPNAWPYP